MFPSFRVVAAATNGGTNTHSQHYRIGMTEAREPLATVQEAVEPATAASPAAKPAAPVTGAPAQNENAYSEIQRRAKAGSFCFGTDDDVKPAALPVPKSPVEPVDDSIARVDPRTLDLKDLRTACRERGLLVGGGKDALVERLVAAIAAGTCAPMPPLGDAFGHVAGVESRPGSKRSSPCAAAAAADVDDDAPVARKIARTQHAGNAIFADGDKQTRDPSWAPKADAFLGEMLSSPAKKVTVSEAKLRDLGVGRDVFSDVASPSVASRRCTGKGAREESVSGLRGCDIFADVETAKETFKETEATRAKAKEAKGSDIFADSTPEAAKDETKKKATGLGKVFAGGVAREFISSVAFGDEDAAMNNLETSRNVNFGHKAVSDAMRASMIGNRLFGEGSDEAERDAAAARAAAARRKDGVEARVIGGAHHDGHGIFSAEWTTARTDEEEAEAALVGALEEAPKIRMDTPESVRRFKPIGASTPEVDFRWKTEEEEAREEAVAEFVAGCIQRVIERATVDEEEDEEA